MTALIPKAAPNSRFKEKFVRDFHKSRKWYDNVKYWCCHDDPENALEVDCVSSKLRLRDQAYYEAILSE